MNERMIPLRLLPPARRRSGVISVTVPSRKRTRKLEKSIQSLVVTAARPDLIEVLVAHDPDDQETKLTAFMMNADVIWEAPERYGYAHSARYWAALCERATGEWFLPTWSDDAIMKTGCWDDKLREQRPGTVAYLDGNYPGLTCFPAVHGDALSAIGRLPDLPALDTWFEYAGRDAGVLVYPGIYVQQNRPDINGAPSDETYIEGGGGWRASLDINHQSFFEEPYVSWRGQDTMALKWHAELEAEYERRLAGDWSDITEQMHLLREAARSYDKPVICELGTRTGNSTAALLAGASASGGHVYSVDCGPVNVPAWWVQTGMWSFLNDDDMGPMAGQFVPGELDVLFIDTTHRYHHTLDELKRYVPRVRPGGVVLMHDVELSIGQMITYGEPGARDDTGLPEFPVAAALDAYCEQAGLTWERQVDRPDPFPDQPFYGLGTIRILERTQREEPAR